MSEEQKANFQDRLARINGPQSAQSMPQNMVTQPSQSKARKVHKEPMLGNFGYPLSIIGAFLLGMICVLISRWARFHIAIGEPTAISYDALVIEGLLAGGIAFIMRHAFNLEDPIHISAKGFGITAMIGLMHNLVWYFPTAFELIFSPEWVELVLDQTEINSFMIGPIAVVFGQ
ncbi:hypothetical protein [Parasulfitobacter algicola]|uniref:Uncharacterized protein n=1 Tax=Parasulfitobacter algicola TaxID=2614809 RepID=A0ABX2IR25_9RHOB|nr:hypothetical protein [Sulfitobacter algicola]NSX55339.1 hypothetical protein [Sulfitobacter algicola]